MPMIIIITPATVLNKNHMMRMIMTISNENADNNNYYQ